MSIGPYSLFLLREYAFHSSREPDQKSFRK